MRETIRKILLVLFSAVFLFAGVMVLREILQYRLSAGYIGEIQVVYAPSSSKTEWKVKQSEKRQKRDTENNSADETEKGSEESAGIDMDAPNPSIQKLVADYPDAVGWLTVEGANVSHPFAIGKDNQTYVRSTLDGDWVRSGTMFIDYRNNRDMADSVSIIYGHNMNDGTMFSTLNRYLDSDYINKYPDVFISLPERTEHYTIWACYVGDAISDPAFTSVASTGNIQELINYISGKAPYYNPEVTPTGDDRLLVLSTCNPSWFYARTVVICIADRE